MIKLITYNEIDKSQWQALIDRSPYATWFQTPEAYEFYASNPEEMTPFVFAVCEDMQLTGVVVGYTTKEKNPIKQLLTCRSIVIGGPLLAEDISEEALTALLEAVKNQPTNTYSEYHERSTENEVNDLQRSDLQAKPIYIETRNFHDYSKWKEAFERSGFEYQPHLNIHVHCDAVHTMSEQRRRQVKKALQHGATIADAQSEEEIRAWYQILQDLYRTKVRTPLFTEEFFIRFYHQQKGKYLLVKYEDKVIGGMMCPILEGKAIYEWYVCGLDEEYKDLYPSVMATYAAIEYAKEHHLPLLDFMGAGVPDIPYGVRDFKMEFGGELVEHGRFLCIRKPLLYKIGKMGVKWLKRTRY